MAHTATDNNRRCEWGEDAPPKQVIASLAITPVQVNTSFRARISPERLSKPPQSETARKRLQESRTLQG